VLDRDILPVATQIKDAAYAAHEMRKIVTVVTYGFSHDEVAKIESPPGVLVIEPWQLPEAENLLRTRATL
jgi:hypothetical protein